MSCLGKDKDAGLWSPGVEADIADGISLRLEQLLVARCGSSEQLGNGDSSDIGRSASDIARTADDSTNDGSVSVVPSEEDDKRQRDAGDAELAGSCAPNDRHSQMKRIHSYPGCGEQGHRRGSPAGSDRARRGPAESKVKAKESSAAREKKQKNAKHAQAQHQGVCCDFHAFKRAATPVLPGSAQCRRDDMTLGDLWHWFEEPSLFGCPVSTTASSLGPSTAFFVPLLSAMRLYTCHSHAAERTEDDSLLMCRYVGAEPHPTAVQSLALFQNRKLPWDRAALSQEVSDLSRLPPSDSIPNPAALFSTRLCDVHPSSWFAVWWQPLYRIPDMPLEAKFLAYYSFQSIQPRIRDARTACLQLPISGLICGSVALPLHNGQPSAPDEEQWLKPRPAQGSDGVSAQRRGAGAQRAILDDVQALHGCAQCLSCNWPPQVEVLLPNGVPCEDMGHNDFAFLQRGRLANSTTC